MRKFVITVFLRSGGVISSPTLEKTEDEYNTFMEGLKNLGSVDALTLTHEHGIKYIHGDDISYVDITEEH